MQVKLNKNYYSICFAAALGLFYIIIQIFLGLNYPLFRDEYYYIACAAHPDYGYVDQPPFSILILSVWKLIFGTNQLSLRIIPALLQVPLFIFASLISKEIGGNTLSGVIAVVTTAFALPVFAMFSYYSMNSFDMVLWAVLFYILLRIINTGNQKLWITFGITAGFGLMNKISILFFIIGLALSLLLSEHRKFYKNKYFWSGMFIAVAIFLPYIIWQFYHDFATLEFIRNASRYKIASLSQFDFIKEQLLSNNPVNAAFWLTGLLSLLFIKKYRKYRMLGVLYIVLLIFFLLNKSKPYYLFPSYIVLFAAGSVYLVSFFENRHKIWIVYTSAALVVITSLLLSPLVIPVLTPEAYVSYASGIGLRSSVGENRQQGLLPQFFADRFGWRELAQNVSDAYISLPADDKKNCFVYAENYGEAGAMDYYRKEMPIPPVLCGHNNYWYWIKEPDTNSVFIIIGGEEIVHRDNLRTINEFGIHSHPFAMPDENNLKIYIGKGFKYPLKELMNKIKIFI